MFFIFLSIQFFTIICVFTKPEKNNHIFQIQHVSKVLCYYQNCNNGFVGMSKKIASHKKKVSLSFFSGAVVYIHRKFKKLNITTKYVYCCIFSIYYFSYFILELFSATFVYIYIHNSQVIVSLSCSPHHLKSTNEVKSN